MKQGFRPILVVLAFLLTATLACAIPGNQGTPTPPPEPTPQGDTIFFTAPYTINLDPGTTIPGTRLTYVQTANNLYELSIDGLQAYRQIGDSLTWRGVVAPGVFADYRLRLQSTFRGQLQAEGQVDIAVLNPAPVELPPTQTPPGSIYYGSMSVNYFVPGGMQIPGTTLVYEGLENQRARLTGTAAFPYFAQDDSLLWLGKLRDNVYIRYNMRVSTLDEQGLGLRGTAELWILD